MNGGNFDDDFLGGDAPWPGRMDEASVREMMAQRVRQHLVQAAGAEPVRVARALELAGRSGMPVDVLERTLERAQVRTDADRYAEAMVQSSALGPWMARDPINARIARHDYDNLAELDRAWTAFTRAGPMPAVAPPGAVVGARADRSGDADNSARRMAFGALADRVAGLTMARLSPERTQDVVRAIVGQGGPRAVLVPVKDVMGHLGTLPPAEAEERAHAWGVDELLQPDADTQGELVTPTETYLARLHSGAGKDIGRNIRFAEPRSLGHCLGECAERIARGDHYPSPSEWTRDLSYLGAALGTPFPKNWLGRLGRRTADASHYTNLISASRFLFPPNSTGKRLTMPWTLLGTRSIPAFAGRVSGPQAVPFIGYDAVHFGGCMGDCMGNPRPEDIQVPPHA